MKSQESFNIGVYMQKLRYLLIILITFLLFQTSFSQTLPQVAVLEFEGRGITEMEAGPLTDRFRSEIVRTNAFLVVSRSQMKAILDEQSFQMGGCTSTECAVEIGQMLNAQKIVVGTIGKIHTTFTVDISIIDVETARIEKSVNRDHKGNIDGLLPILKEIAFEMIPPRKGLPKMPLVTSRTIALGSTAVSVFSVYMAKVNHDKYKNAIVGKDATKYKDATEFYDNLAIITGATAGATLLFYYVYNNYYRRSKKPVGFYATPFIQNDNICGLALNINF